MSNQGGLDHPAFWRGEEWSSLGEAGRGWARGYAFLDDGCCLEDDAIAGYLALQGGGVESTVAAMNGCFAAAFESADGTATLVTDRYGTTPLYTVRGATFFASPDPWRLVGVLDSPPTLDPLGAFDLLRTGYVPGTGTLLSHIETLPPSTIATVKGRDLSLRRYWRYGYRPTRLLQEDAEEELVQIFQRIGQRVGGYLSSRSYRPGITLSGGLDSRVLAAVLPGAFAGGFAALSYGVQGDPEIEVARDVATSLGLGFRSSIIALDDLDSSIGLSVHDVGVTTRFTCGLGVRSADMSDIDVLIPGHTGDFVTGNHLGVAAALVRTPAQLRHYLELRHFRYPGSEALLRDVLRLDYDATRWSSLQSTTTDFDFTDDVFGLIDRWNVENRQRRLILMELRSYESRGRWMLPFYDHELIDFYATLPHELRLGQNLYLRTATRRLFQGHAARLSDLRRIGGSMCPNTTLPRRVERLRRLHPVSGSLVFGLAPFRDVVRTLRPKTEQRFGTDPIKRWFREESEFRERVLTRLRSVDVDAIDAERLSARLESGDEDEQAYNRLLPGVVTIDECLNRARGVWSASQKSAAVQGPPT